MNEKLNMELTKLIAKAAIDGTLSESAVKQFTDVIEENRGLRDQVKIDAEKIVADNKEISKLNTRCENMQKQILLNAERVADLEKREKDITRNELLAEYNAIRVKDHQEMFKVVFRNAIIRREMVTPGSASFDQYNNKTDNFPDKTPAEEEET